MRFAEHPALPLTDTAGYTSTLHVGGLGVMRGLGRKVGVDIVGMLGKELTLSQRSYPLILCFDSTFQGCAEGSEEGGGVQTKTFPGL